MLRDTHPNRFSSATDVLTKLGMWANLDAPSLRHAMELENRTQVLGTFTGNMGEAGKAFREKRDPEWAPM